MTVEVKPFDPSFVDAVANLILPIQREEFGLAITAEDQPDLRDIPGFYQRSAGQFWIAINDSHVVGLIALLDIGGNEAALRKMFVAREFRGSRYGVAANLLGALLAHARSHGITAIYLGTTDKFIAAHRFYEKTGFSLIASEHLPSSFPRMAVDSRFYVLRKF